jgi:superoxide reductase
MTQRLQVYECQICGNMVEILRAGGGTLVCCNQEMKLLEEHAVDTGKEKHLPVIEKIDGGYKVSVGEVTHPMAEDHFIEFIELIAGATVQRKFLAPGEAPVAEFTTTAEDVQAREHCNKHGLWKA